MAAHTYEYGLNYMALPSCSRGNGNRIMERDDGEYTYFYFFF